MGFIFGGNTNLTPEQVKRQREIARALLRGGRMPRNVGEGLTAVGDAISGRIIESRANKAEKSGREEFASLLGDYVGGTADRGVPEIPPAVDAGSAVPSAFNVDKTLPRGIRNNNPGNIEAGAFTQKLPGFIGSDGRFAQFETPEQGVNAMGQLLESYGRRGHNTLSKIINRWAPSTENNTRAYIQSVASNTGIDPNMPLDLSDPNIKNAVTQAMILHENGMPLPSSLGAGESTILPRGQVDSLAAPQQVAQALNTQQGAQRGPSGIDPQLMRILNHRFAGDATPGQKMLIDTMLKQQMEAGQPPDPMEQARLRNLQLRNQQLMRDPNLLSPDALEQQLQLKPETNISVDTTGNAFAKKFGAMNAEAFFERRAAANDAVASLSATHQAKQLLDSGIITGAGAEWIVSAGKALQRMGVNMAEDPIANTEAFAATRAQEVGRIIKLFGAGTGLSDADREFATKAAAGEITMNEQSIRRILDINEKASLDLITRFNKDAEAIDPQLSPFPLQIEVPEFGSDPREQAKEELRRRKTQSFPEGATEEDIQHTMKKHGMTREQVLEAINAR